MATEPEQGGVRKVSDEWIEVPTTTAEGFGVDWVQLRPGPDDGEVELRNAPPVGVIVQAADLHRAVDLIEKEAA